jgi:DNA-binding LacI/PurR family transcriptional regulator
MALHYLIQLGHRNIGFVAGERDRHYDWFDSRVECYRNVMIELNGEVNEDLIVVGVDGAEAAQTLMEKWPDVTAIWAIYDDRALEAMLGLQEMGLCIPEDVSVIGLDDTCTSPEGCPQLTTVGFPGKKVGSLAAELLLRQLEDSLYRFAHIVVGSYLVERESCAKPRCLAKGHSVDKAMAST